MRVRRRFEGRDDLLGGVGRRSLCVDVSFCFNGL